MVNFTFVSNPDTTTLVISVGERAVKIRNPHTLNEIILKVLNSVIQDISFGSRIKDRLDTVSGRTYASFDKPEKIKPNDTNTNLIFFEYKKKIYFNPSNRKSASWIKAYPVVLSPEWDELMNFLSKRFRR